MDTNANYPALGNVECWSVHQEHVSPSLLYIHIYTHTHTYIYIHVYMCISVYIWIQIQKNTLKVVFWRWLCKTNWTCWKNTVEIPCLILIKWFSVTLHKEMKFVQLYKNFFCTFISAYKFRWRWLMRFTIPEIRNFINTPTSA